MSRARASGAAGALGEETILRRTCEIVHQHAIPCLSRTDWKGNRKPEQVGFVYAVLLMMSAADIHRECV